MLGKYAGFIDYGFLDAAGSKALGRHKTDVKPDAAGCVEWLRSVGGQLEGTPTLLRVYWYDAAFAPTDERYSSQRRYFDAIARTPGVQLRLGHLRERTPNWHYALRRSLERCEVNLEEFEEYFDFKKELSQKGVDTLITLDLVRLAQSHAYQTAILLAGDRDLAEPVRVAQDSGCRVLLAVPPGAGVAEELRQVADEVISLDHEVLRQILRVAERPAASQSS
ncbi:MAG TPA: NYN domain-containing protein [Solirubrobacteraceae bacterium]|nr:NYN domain-containing protein [Solirubrobacteraceae bacterium]